MKIYPVADRLYILVDEMVDKKGRIFLPAVHSERTRTATIMAIGDEVDSKKFKVGDSIIIAWHAGLHLHLIGEDIVGDLHRIISINEILAKYK